jgi:transcriptional regulator
MYIPRYYRVEDREQIAEFLTRNAFGIIVAQDSGRPLAVHAPCEFKEVEDALICEFHVARGNPIWQHAPNNPEVLAIFPGPHTYISPSWYRDPNVPTWNYQAVHLYGSCQVMSDEELAGFLERMVARYEGGRPQARTWDTLTPEFRNKQMRAIVGLSITVTRIEAAAKMSQNRSDEDFVNIVHQLESSKAPADVSVSQVMRGVRPDVFES